MLRGLAFADAVGYCALALMVYKFFELGPYEAAALLGRCLRIFIAAVEGYI
jgi:hypothetical protein